MIESLTCADCGTRWEYDRRSGHAPARCAECAAEARRSRRRARYAENREANSEYKKAYREANRDRINAKERERNAINRDARRAAGKRYRERFPERARTSSARWRQGNSARIAEYRRRYNAENPSRSRAWKHGFASTEDLHAYLADFIECPNPRCATVFESDTQKHIDHDHDAPCGCTAGRSCRSCRRGVLCTSCNTKLGWYELNRDWVDQWVSTLRTEPEVR